MPPLNSAIENDRKLHAWHDAPLSHESDFGIRFRHPGGLTEPKRKIDDLRGIWQLGWNGEPFLDADVCLAGGL